MMKTTPPDKQVAQPAPFLSWVVSALAVFLAAAGPPPGSVPPEATQALLDQATYWRTNQTRQAVASLERLLKLDPDNADGLIMLVQIDMDQNLPAEAAATLKRLQAAHPQDPRLPSLEQSVRAGPPDQALLTQARSQAQAGNRQEAIDTYRRVFKGDAPPPVFAAEFYLTLSGVAGQFDTARQGLATAVSLNPQDLPLQLAYAQLLSYNEGTRIEAIDRLQVLEQQPAIAVPARRAWRQALLWQGADYRSQAQLETYLSRVPADPEMLAKRDEYNGSLASENTRDNMAGFAALEAHKAGEAEKQFLAALAFNPKDPDASIMMAVIRKSQNRMAEAKRYEAQALALAPDRRDEYLATFGANQAQGAGQAGDGGRAITAAYARVNRLAAHGDYAAAEALLRRQMAGRPQRGNYIQLGYLQLGAGELSEAEASFRRALAMAPRDPAAMSGLADVLARRGDTLEAEALYTRAGNRGALRSLGQLHATELRKQAHEASDPAERLRLIQAAVDAAPEDPWLRLELARALRADHRAAEATPVMAAVGTMRKPTQDDVQAAVIWAEESGDVPRAAQLIATVPPRQRTGHMAAIVAKAEIQPEIRQAEAAPVPEATLSQLFAAANQPDPTGARGVAVAQALLGDGNREAAQQALTLAVNATRPPTAVQRLAYAGLLSRTGLVEAGRRMAQQIEARQLPRDERVAFDGLRDGFAIQRADRLNGDGKQADAYDVLKPRLQAEPDNAGLNLALSRLYQKAERPKQALAVSEAVLQRAPDDLDVRRAVVGAAVQAQEIGRAREVADQSVEVAPDDPRPYLMVADIARANGQTGQALSALRKARELRLQQLKDAPPADDTAAP